MIFFFIVHPTKFFDYSIVLPSCVPHTYEIALIVGHSDQTRDERLAAWRELINNYPDMPDPDNQFESVHDELARMIELEERELAVFKTSEPGAYYKISKRKHRYESFEDALFVTHHQTDHADYAQLY